MQAQAERRAVCCELVSEVARHAGEVRLKLNGTSMLPAMWPGDLVTVRQCQPIDLRPGQIVLYRTDAGLVAHRVIRLSSNRLVTRGDSVPRCDPPVEPSAIIGYVASITRDNRSIPTIRTWRHRTLSALLRRSHLCLRILLRIKARNTAPTNSPAMFAPSEVL